MDNFERSFQRIRAILKQQKWTGVEEATSYSTPSLKVKGKMLVRVREPGVLVLMCNLEAKEMLMQVAPHIYFELPHYRGYPAVLVHMDQIEDDELAEMIEAHWRKIAPKKMVAEYDVSPKEPPKATAKKPAVKKSPAPSSVRKRPSTAKGRAKTNT